MNRIEKSLIYTNFVFIFLAFVCWDKAQIECKRAEALEIERDGWKRCLGAASRCMTQYDENRRSTDELIGILKHRWKDVDFGH